MLLLSRLITPYEIKNSVLKTLPLAPAPLLLLHYFFTFLSGDEASWPALGGLGCCVGNGFTHRSSENSNISLPGFLQSAVRGPWGPGLYFPMALSLLSLSLLSWPVFSWCLCEEASSQMLVE